MMRQVRQLFVDTMAAGITWSYTELTIADLDLPRYMWVNPNSLSMNIHQNNGRYSHTHVVELLQQCSMTILRKSQNLFSETKAQSMQPSDRLPLAILICHGPKCLAKFHQLSTRVYSCKSELLGKYIHSLYETE